MNNSEIRYSQTHEWAKVEGDLVRVGVSDHAQSELGEVVFVEAPIVGNKVSKDEAFGSLESYKTVSDLLSPVSGEIIHVNDALASSPVLINESPMDQGWIAAIKPNDMSELDTLMTYEEYEAFIKEH